MLYRASLNCPLPLEASSLLEVQSVPLLQGSKWKSSVKLCPRCSQPCPYMPTQLRLYSQAAQWGHQVLPTPPTVSCLRADPFRLIAATSCCSGSFRFFVLFVSSTAGQCRRYQELRPAVPWTAAGSLSFKLSKHQRIVVRVNPPF